MTRLGSANLHFGEYFRTLHISLCASLRCYALRWFENWNGILCNQEYPLPNQRGSLCSFLPSVGPSFLASTPTLSSFLASTLIFSSFLASLFGPDGSCNHSVITLL